MSRRPGDVCENARLADRLALERLRPFDDHSNLGTLRQVHRRRKLNLPVLDDTNHFQHHANSIIREALAPVTKKPAPNRVQFCGKRGASPLIPPRMEARSARRRRGRIRPW